MEGVSFKILYIVLLWVVEDLLVVPKQVNVIRSTDDVKLFPAFVHV